MKIISLEAATDPESTSLLSEKEILWVYNALDCLVTSEVKEKLEKQLDPTTSWIYKFELACLAPAMEMALRGIKVDTFERNNMILKLEDSGEKLEELLREYGVALGHSRGINANSIPQLKSIFYDQLKFPQQVKYDRVKKEEKVSVDREALEKLSVSPLANPLTQAILARRDAVKKLSVLRSGIDSDGKMRFSFNVGGTETGRWSSSRNAFGGGMNAQNITEEIRHIFISNPEKKLAYIDLEQAESRLVAFLSKDPAYLEACGSGDLHTTVTKLIWPELGWANDLAKDRQIADRPFYRQFTYRDMAKRGGHGSNYLGTPRTMAKFLKIEHAIMESFQRGYFKAFPGIKAWHHSVATELQSKGVLTTPFGRRRHFFGRLSDNTTLREAVAYLPQSFIADYMNAGVCRLWSWGKVDLLAQVHDAVVFEYEEGREDLVREAARLLSKSIDLPSGERISIPCEAAVGWNWGKYSEKNKDGLKKLKEDDKRTRQLNGQQTPHSILDRRFS